MANISRFVTSLKPITKYFLDTGRLAFSQSEINGIFEDKRVVWNLPISMNLDRFTKQLVNKLNFEEHHFEFPGMTLRKVYAASGASVIDVASAIFDKGYLSHYTAISLMGLTQQIPKVVYLSLEQSKKNFALSGNLTQTAIDAAFSKTQRVSESKLDFKGYEIMLLKGKHTNNLGVRYLGNTRSIRVTDTERTLIDAAVRPGYSGGIAEVQKAYYAAKVSGNISINKLIGYLSKMEFIYPYHQAIGFYLERTGLYDDTQLQKLKDIPQPFKFYLAYDMKEMDYSKEWELFYPKGF
jgi:hypothetical protein